ncbi:MAG: response regulator [Desulfuromonadales bacterium]|nr:MAG: response regulator [Desulfuromonadales bacterium]
MNPTNTKFSLLHVEDDPMLVELVMIAFGKFGFSGESISAGSVKEALELLDTKERAGEPFSLILTDMKLPDGTGLDLIREVRSSSYWHLTPVVVLSSEVAPGTIDSAYALGANCYVSKVSATRQILVSLKALYECWMEGAILPQSHSVDRVQDLLAKSVALRTRTANFYMGLARAFEAVPEEEGFWLDRALYEGNISNLLVFFRGSLRGADTPLKLLEHIGTMQVRVRDALAKAENQLNANSSPSPVEAYRWVLDIMDVLDEEIFAQVLGLLFPKEPVATAALMARAAGQMQDLAARVLERTEEPLLHVKAARLRAWADRLNAGVPGGQA